MATVATRGIGVTNLHHPHNQKSLFLGHRLRFKPSNNESSPPSFTARFTPKAFHGGEWLHSVHNLFVGVGVGLPCTVMECGDMIYRSTLPRPSGLTVTIPGVVLAFGALSYLWATPGVAPGFFDMFVLAFVERLFRPTY
ncbi:serine/threonine-protein kinase STN7 chloroplastic-like, partial [Trifolium medium]|nr:serine/threonine-protein kinase STN7 chloroplastic-like [Trifolium medium]